MEAAELEMIKMFVGEVKSHIDAQFVSTNKEISDVKAIATQTRNIVTGNGTPREGLCFKFDEMKNSIEALKVSVGQANVNSMKATEIAKGNEIETPGDLAGKTVEIVGKAIKK